MTVHIPVLLAEVVAALAPAPGRHLVDGTFGGGGYSAAFLDAGATVTAFDRDLRSLAAGACLQARAGGRLRLVNRSFADMADELGAASADGVALDLGYSSIQLDDPAYGLSFQLDGPLDMRLSGTGPTAADFLNGASEADIADVLFRYGEEPAARRIARAVVAARPIATTVEFAALVRRVVKAPPGSRRDPATRSFQALRIHVNDELAELERGLVAAEAVLKPGGQLAVVSFHSLEDRIVKRFLAERGGAGPAASRHLPAAAPRARPSFERPARPRRPSDRELALNPRARSATLRVARRTAEPGWGARAAGRGGDAGAAAGQRGGRR